MYETAMNILSAVSAVIAAVLWLVSARIATPQQFSIELFVSLAHGSWDGSVSADGSGSSDQLNRLGEALRSQSRWSARAAIAACVAALAQALAIGFHLWSL